VVGFLMVRKEQANVLPNQINEALLILEGVVFRCELLSTVEK